MDILDLARRNQQKAWKIIEDTKIIPAWESVGARVNLVGSLNTGLLMKHLDIDFHIYTPQFIRGEKRCVSKFSRSENI
jgi:DNA polymerase sigma